jgi:hypothetical protein
VEVIKNTHFGWLNYFPSFCNKIFIFDIKIPRKDLKNSTIPVQSEFIKNQKIMSTQIGQVVYNPETQTFAINFIVHHAYILVVTILTFIIHTWLGARVSGARKTYNVQLPHLYEAAKENGEAKSPFNNFQRGHMV